MRKAAGPTFDSCARTIRGGSLTWFGGAPSSRAPLASGPIAVSFLLLLGVRCSGGGGGTGTFSFLPTLAGAVAEPSMVPLQGDLLLSGPPLLLEHGDH